VARARVHVLQRARRRIEHGDERGGEHVRAAVRARDVVVRALNGGTQSVANARRGRELRLRERAQETAEQRHEQRRADSLAAHVREHERHAAVRQRESVVEISRHLPRRPEVRTQLPSIRGRQRVGEEAELDLAADLELALQALGVLCSPSCSCFFASDDATRARRIAGLNGLGR
jgi:hypothetical protein